MATGGRFDLTAGATGIQKHADRIQKRFDRRTDMFQKRSDRRNNSIDRCANRLDRIQKQSDRRIDRIQKRFDSGANRSDRRIDSEQKRSDRRNNSSQWTTNKCRVGGRGHKPRNRPRFACRFLRLRPRPHLLRLRPRPEGCVLGCALNSKTRGTRLRRRTGRGKKHCHVGAPHLQSCCNGLVTKRK